jgi:Cof subfamily protein (haloacid dehalogenase superfamily)
MLKLFVTDLDGTLLGKSNHIIKQDIKAIDDLKNSDVDFAIASGRSDQDITEIMKLINQTAHRISQNGAFVYNKKNELLNGETFPLELSKQLFAAITMEEHFVAVSTADEIYTTMQTEITEEFEKNVYHPLTIEPNLNSLIGKTVHPSKITVIGETTDILRLKDKMDQTFQGKMESFLSDKYCVDFVPKEITKGSGLTHLLNNLHIRPHEIACIGDSFNDIQMLQFTPNSYAMSTAHPEVQKHAAHVVNHVYEAIEHLRTQGLY